MEEEKKEEIEVKQTVEDTPTVPNNTVNVVTNPPIKPNKSYKGLIITLVIIILLLIAALVYFIFFNKPKEEGGNVPKPTPTVSPEETIEPTPTEEQENETNNGELVIYKSVYFDDITIEDKKDDEDYAPVAKINVHSKEAKLLALDNHYSSFVLYNDDGLYIYNIKTKKTEKVNLENTYKEYNIFLNEKEDKIIGISYLKSDKSSGYYNVLENKKLYDGKYKANEDNYISFMQINDSHFTIYNYGGVYLLDSTKEKVELSTTFKETEGGMTQYRSLKSNNTYIYVREMCITEYCGIEKIYDENFKEIIKVNSAINETLFSYYNGYIYMGEEIYDGNNLEKYIVSKYDTSGNKITSSDKNTMVYMIYNNLVVYKKDNSLVIENIDNSEEYKEIKVDYSKEWSFDEFDSGYYSREFLDSMGEKEKKEGLYIVIEYDDKDSKGNYGMEYCYTPNKQIIEYPIKEMIGGRAKPVLYLYPEKETNVTVKFERPNLLTTTYPKYINSWNVNVKPNGDMYDKDGKYYYALYWDEKRYNEVDFKEGFYVEDKDAIKFLEEKLTYIGLNDKERNEFIMYWLPIMENNKKNLVYFELTKERELGNKLIITPKPDSLLRVSIHIKKVNEKVNIKEQKLESFKRVGFTAVEWGGMTY